MQWIGSSPRCPCGRHYVATMPTDHVCPNGTGQIVYQVHADQTAGAPGLAPLVTYHPRPEPREREERKRWLEEHARKYAGRRP